MIRFQPLYWIDADTRGVEVLSAVMLFVYGGFLLLPIDTFGAAPGYDAMAMLAPEPVWGALMLGGWLMQSLAMCGNVRLLRYPAALTAMGLWTVLGTSLFAGAPWTFPGPFMYGCLALAMVWVIWRGPSEP